MPITNLSLAGRAGLQAPNKGNVTNATSTNAIKINNAFFFTFSPSYDFYEFFRS
jgi:hypothetical protein